MTHCTPVFLSPQGQEGHSLTLCGDTPSDKVKKTIVKNVLKRFQTVLSFLLHKVLQPQTQVSEPKETFSVRVIGYFVKLLKLVERGQPPQQVPMFMQPFRQLTKVQRRTAMGMVKALADALTGPLFQIE